MYAEAQFGDGGGTSTPMIPRGAVQNVGNRTVVYLVNPNEPATSSSVKFDWERQPVMSRLGPGGGASRAMWWLERAVSLCGPSVNTFGLRAAPTSTREGPTGVDVGHKPEAERGRVPMLTSKPTPPKVGDNTLKRCGGCRREAHHKTYDVAAMFYMAAIRR